LGVLVTGWSQVRVLPGEPIQTKRGTSQCEVPFLVLLPPKIYTLNPQAMKSGQDRPVESGVRRTRHHRYTC